MFMFNFVEIRRKNKVAIFLFICLNRPNEWQARQSLISMFPQTDGVRGHSTPKQHCEMSVACDVLWGNCLEPVELTCFKDLVWEG